MNRKLLIVLSLILVLSMVATACSPPQGGDSQPTTGSEEPANVEEPAAEKKS